MFESLFKYSREDYARGEIVFINDWPEWLLYALVVVAVIAVAAGLYRRSSYASTLVLLSIGMLQLAMIAVVMFILLQPTLSSQVMRDGENSVALALDNSASMTHGLTESRFAAARQNLNNAIQADTLQNLSLRHYELGDSAELVDSFLSSTPTENATSMAGGLLRILDEARFSPLAAVVLASDGADTNGGLSADELAEIAAFGVPIHTIGVGREAMPEDIELSNVTVPDNSLPGSTVSARVTIRHDQAANARIKVYDGDDLVQLMPIELSADSTVTTAWVDVALNEAGPHQLGFSVESDAVEPESRNNERATLINVANEDYRILYYEGEPRWEYKFLRRAIAHDDDLNVATLLRVSPNKFYRQGIDDALQLQDGFPQSRDELFTYDALIIGSVEAASLTTEQQEIIRDFVSNRGGSLLMLAGPNGLGNGGWGQSALASVLPTSLPATTIDSFHRLKSTVSLTAQGADNQILRFVSDSDENRDAWRELPQVADYQLTGSLKPAAVTLLNAETDAGQTPLLVTQAFGRGHAFILATGGTWRWQMSLPVEDQRHETFWRQMLRALVASAPENVSLVANPGKDDISIELRAEFRDAAFRPVNDVGVTTIASHESGESISILMRPDEAEPGVFLGQLTPPQSGTWYFEAVVESEGEPVAVARASILHATGQAEHFGFRRNSGLLQRLALATGGQYFADGDLSELPDLLRYSSSGITETEHKSIWDSPAFYLLLLLLKSSEWMLRRRWSSI